MHYCALIIIYNYLSFLLLRANKKIFETVGIDLNDSYCNVYKNRNRKRLVGYIVKKLVVKICSDN
jgi:hypothetical protein